MLTKQRDTKINKSAKVNTIKSGYISIAAQKALQMELKWLQINVLQEITASGGLSFRS